MGFTARNEAAAAGVSRQFLLTTSTRRLAFLLFLVSLTGLVAMATGEESLAPPRPRYKRAIYQLCAFIHRYTGRGCLSYNNYGCYCGYGTSTATPVDAVDDCCRQHDLCYINIINSDACIWRPHFIHYDNECTANSCTCTDSPTSCSYRTCMCDLAAAQCFQAATYNRNMRGYDRSQCSGQ